MLSLTGNPFENTENDFMDLIAIGLPSCVEFFNSTRTDLLKENFKKYNKTDNNQKDQNIIS